MNIKYIDENKKEIPIASLDTMGLINSTYIDASKLNVGTIAIDSTGTDFKVYGGTYWHSLYDDSSNVQLHTCLYCGTRYKLDLYKCPNCYAPNKSE